MKRPTGTREWSSSSVNISEGCENDCLYCYARYDALRYGRIKTAEEWPNAVIQKHKVEKSYGKRKGTIMFPTTHDIFSSNLSACVTVLKKMLTSGNRVLVVSKPNFDCIEEICHQLKDYKKQILFRFTIGSLDNEVLKFWEPNAPNLTDRVLSLGYAYKKGFETSVSCEPLLDPMAIDLYGALKPVITHSIWFGGLNKHEQRVDMTGWGAKENSRLHAMKEAKAPWRVMQYYRDLKNEPLVFWKDGFKEIIGLEEPTAIGMDV